MPSPRAIRYILFDEAGEMHPPKTQTEDGGRAEVGLSELLEQHMREQVLRDLMLMGDRGSRLHRVFFASLGELRMPTFYRPDS